MTVWATAAGIAAALEQGLEFPLMPTEQAVLSHIAPKIEAALRAAYTEGFGDHIFDIDHGVTAGIAKLSEET